MHKQKIWVGRPDALPLDTMNEIELPCSQQLREGTRFSMKGHLFQITYISSEGILGFLCQTTGYRHRSYIANRTAPNSDLWTLVQNTPHGNTGEEEEEISPRKGEG